MKIKQLPILISSQLQKQPRDCDQGWSHLKEGGIMDPNIADQATSNEVYKCMQITEQRHSATSNVRVSISLFLLKLFSL